MAMLLQISYIGMRHTLPQQCSTVAISVPERLLDKLRTLLIAEKYRALFGVERSVHHCEANLDLFLKFGPVRIFTLTVSLFIKTLGR